MKSIFRRLLPRRAVRCRACGLLATHPNSEEVTQDWRKAQTLGHLKLVVCLDNMPCYSLSRKHNCPSFTKYRAGMSPGDHQNLRMQEQRQRVGIAVALTGILVAVATAVPTIVCGT